MASNDGRTNLGPKKEAELSELEQQALDAFIKQSGFDLGTIPEEINRNDFDRVLWLKQHPSWLKAAEIIYELEEDKSWAANAKAKGYSISESRIELSEWALNHMDWTDNNAASMLERYLESKKATPEQQAALLYMMRTYSKISVSIEGAFKALWQGLFSPENLLIIGGATASTGPVGFLVSLFAMVGKTAAVRGALTAGSKLLSRNLYKTILDGGLTGALGGALHADLKQRVEANSSNKILKYKVDRKSVV